MGVHRTVKQMGKGDSKKPKKTITFEKWLTMTPNGLGINQITKKFASNPFKNAIVQAQIDNNH